MIGTPGAVAKDPRTLGRGTSIYAQDSVLAFSDYRQHEKAMGRSVTRLLRGQDPTFSQPSNLPDANLTSASSNLVLRGCGSRRLKACPLVDDPSLIPSFPTMANDELANLRTTVSSLSCDLDDMKELKCYLLDHNKELKFEVAKLKEELQQALARCQPSDGDAEPASRLPTSATTDMTQPGHTDGRRFALEVHSSKIPITDLEPTTTTTTTTNAGSAVDANGAAAASERASTYHDPKVVELRPKDEAAGANCAGPTATSSVSDRKRKRSDSANGLHDLAAKKPKTIEVVMAALRPEGTAPNPSGPVLLNTQRPRTPIGVNLDALQLPSHVATTYMKDHPAVTIRSPSKVHVSRKLLSKRFGGSATMRMQQTHADKDPSGRTAREFIFPNHSKNAWMPLRPGESGLIFEGHYYNLEKPQVSLFTHHQNGVKAVWEYLGEYTTTVVGTMSAELFRSQRESAKQHWAATVIKDRQNPAKDQKAIVKEMNAIDEQKGSGAIKINEEDVITAFSRGEEEVGITLLKCIDYDWELAGAIEAERKQRYGHASGSTANGARLPKSHVSPRHEAGKKKYSISSVQAGDYAVATGSGSTASMRSCPTASSNSGGNAVQRPQRARKSIWNASKGQKVQGADGYHPSQYLDSDDEERSVASTLEESDDEYEEVDGYFAMSWPLP
ncbi:hypothetical protein NMY22_g7101 [Coprinellus aureogranulatus]|nr:hypothetical protein NMY22_g7101 [Coprinellus aureogranulatus]